MWVMGSAPGPLQEQLSAFRPIFLAYAGPMLKASKQTKTVKIGLGVVVYMPLIPALGRQRQVDEVGHNYIIETLPRKKKVKIAHTNVLPSHSLSMSCIEAQGQKSMLGVFLNHP